MRMMLPHPWLATHCLIVLCFAVPATATTTVQTTSASPGPCQPNPCIHGGDCSTDGVDAGSYKCYCKPGWVGDRCEHIVSPHLNCTSSYVELQISLSVLENLHLDPANIHLEDPSCHGSSSGDYLILRSNLKACGTTSEAHGDTIVYTNSAYGYVTGTKAKKLRIPMHCYIGSEGKVIASFAPRVVDEYSSGSFNLSMVLYTNQAFSQAVNSYPFEVDLGSPIYVEVLLNSFDNNLQLLLETCKASPYTGAPDNASYIIVQSGCQVDTSYVTYTSGDDKRQRFSFQSVELNSSSQQVYLECNVRVCDKSDVNSRCRRGCVRSKRSVRDVRASGTRPEHNVDLSQGPISIRKRSTGSSSSVPVAAYAVPAALAGAAATALVIGLLIKFKCLPWISGAPYSFI